MPSSHPGANGAALRDTGSLLRLLARYWATVFPVVRSEIAQWKARARAIPNSELRSQACANLTGEQLNAEGAAVFAVLGARAHHATVARLLVRFQVMYDYLDTLTEQPVKRRLQNSRCLHHALAVAVGAPRPRDGYYAHHPCGDDGGYLESLASACRVAFQRLPASRCVMPTLRRAIARSAEGQSRNHAAMPSGSAAFIRWCSALPPHDSDLRWWENGAAAGSSLAIHALLAAAGDLTVTRAKAERIHHAYWPWVNGLNTLLESMVDRQVDAETGNHSYVAYYEAPEAMAQRLGTIAQRASQSVRQLPAARRHELILAAMVSFYLSAPGASAPDARPTACAVRAQLGTDLRLLLAMLRLRRRLSAHTHNA